jgi:hypothetical protein
MCLLKALFALVKASHRVGIPLYLSVIQVHNYYKKCLRRRSIHQLRRTGPVGSVRYDASLGTFVAFVDPLDGWPCS